VGAFSGSSVYGLNATSKGNYFINLNERDAKGPTEMNEKRDNPTAFMGIQAIPHRYINGSGSGTNDNQVYDIQGAFGHGRMRLLETDENDHIRNQQIHGYYLHGKLDLHNWTHGCTTTTKYLVARSNVEPAAKKSSLLSANNNRFLQALRPIGLLMSWPRTDHKPRLYLFQNTAPFRKWHGKVDGREEISW
jgi:hypothetical protein